MLNEENVYTCYTLLRQIFKTKDSKGRVSDSPKPKPIINCILTPNNNAQLIWLVPLHIDLALKRTV